MIRFIIGNHAHLLRHTDECEYCQHDPVAAHRSRGFYVTDFGDDVYYAKHLSLDVHLWLQQYPPRYEIHSTAYQGWSVIDFHDDDVALAFKVRFSGPDFPVERLDTDVDIPVAVQQIITKWYEQTIP